MHIIIAQPEPTFRVDPRPSNPTMRYPPARSITCTKTNSTSTTIRRLPDHDRRLPYLARATSTSHLWMLPNDETKRLRTRTTILTVTGRTDYSARA